MAFLHVHWTPFRLTLIYLTHSFILVRIEGSLRLEGILLEGRGVSWVKRMHVLRILTEITPIFSGVLRRHLGVSLLVEVAMAIFRRLVIVVDSLRNGVWHAWIVHGIKLTGMIGIGHLVRVSVIMIVLSVKVKVRRVLVTPLVLL